MHLPAVIEEQQPLDLESIHSMDDNYSISGEPPSVTIRPVGRNDGALAGSFPSYKVQDTVFVNDPPAPYGTLVPSWRDAGSKIVKQVDSSSLAEYLIGLEAKILLPESYWPKDKVSWTTQPGSAWMIVRTKGVQMMMIAFITFKSSLVPLLEGL